MWKFHEPVYCAFICFSPFGHIRNEATKQAYFRQMVSITNVILSEQYVRVKTILIQPMHDCTRTTGLLKEGHFTFFYSF